MSYIQYQCSNGGYIKAWINGVTLEDKAKAQIDNLASLPFIHSHVAVMPDAHWGMGATVGSVFATESVIIPAAVGVDIGCGMQALRTTLKADRLPESLSTLRSEIERRIPHGRTNKGKIGDRGAWGELPQDISERWEKEFLTNSFRRIVEKYPAIEQAAKRAPYHLGTLGTGNHFVELCIDEEDYVWMMLHSGSRGIGNRIGTYFIELAKEEMLKHGIELPDLDLAYLSSNEKHMDYIDAVYWAQNYAHKNRAYMMGECLDSLHSLVPDFARVLEVVDCHHNYVNREIHNGRPFWITRKGAVCAEKGRLGIIPGSMGTKSYIVRGKGNPESFNSCSHGAGRAMSRVDAKRKFTLEDHIKATEGVECRKDMDVLDETPLAYKDIDKVMEAQSDLVEIVHTLKQVLCVKG